MKQTAALPFVQFHMHAFRCILEHNSIKVSFIFERSIIDGKFTS